MNTTTRADRIMIAIDPHKTSWTAAAVGPLLQPLATIRVPVSRTGYRSLRQFAAQWPDARRFVVEDVDECNFCMRFDGR